MHHNLISQGRGGGGLVEKICAQVVVMRIDYLFMRYHSRDTAHRNRRGILKGRMRFDMLEILSRITFQRLDALFVGFCACTELDLRW